MSAPTDPRTPPAQNGQPRRPNPLDQVKDLAEAGDFAAVLDWFVRPPENMLGACSIAQLDYLLRRAVDQASRQAPQQFAAEIFRQLTAFTVYVTLRLQVCIQTSLGDADARNRHIDLLPEEMDSKLLPMLERLTRLAGEMSLNAASTERRWQLAKRGTRPRRRKAASQKPSARGYTFDDGDGQCN